MSKSEENSKLEVGRKYEQVGRKWQVGGRFGK
jgi:hypothetical protein